MRTKDAQSPLRIYQQEIDPNASAPVTGRVQATSESAFDVWWHRHDEGLVYASVQVFYEASVAGRGRRYAMLRNAVVNLVYDEKRDAVVAIYGNARESRPFVDAFARAYGLDMDSSS